MGGSKRESSCKLANKKLNKLTNMSEENKQKNPHLFCLITGKSRPTTWAYLRDKAARLSIEVDTLINNYVSREAITQLLDGKTVADIRAGYQEAPNTEISEVRLAELIRLNSKAKKAAEKFNIIATTTVDVKKDEEPSEEKPKKTKKKVKSETEETAVEA